MFVGCYDLCWASIIFFLSQAEPGNIKSQPEAYWHADHSCGFEAGTCTPQDMEVKISSLTGDYGGE